MKKIFTLCAALSALSFTAMADVTYQFETRYSQILITNSDPNTSFFAAVLSEDEMDELAAEGITVDTPQELLDAVADMYLDEDNVVDSEEYAVVVPEEGTWTVVVASVEEEDGDYVCTSAPTIASLDIAFRVLDDPINLTIDVKLEGSVLTITPSDLEQSYLFGMSNVEQFEEEMGEELTLETIQFMFDSFIAMPMAYKSKGVETEDLAEEPEDNPYGDYKVFAAAVCPDEVDADKWGWYRAGDICVVDFTYGDPTSIKLDVEGTKMLQKALRDGRIVLNGKYAVDGKMIKD